ncbi:Wzz/FepE/Etk N-terminal domain-containing protein [Massilia sp. TSP1-1-2]|uniref:Wzz/FepE/Etk N-terminal domain-containing protein n=1 Tax=Massilia sp. TSP1-1-2 TaxID=2804649 RepID=UPI003CEEC2F2
MDASSREIEIVDWMLVLVKHKKLVFGLPVLVALLALGLSLLLPNVYTATTKLLPPQQAQSGTAALLAQLGGASSLAAGIAGVKSPGELYVGMLNSRTIADKLIARFGLKSRYGASSLDATRQQLAGSTVVNVGKDGMITIAVADKDPQFVAQLANGYVEELQGLNKLLAITEASQRRLFFERQLAAAKDNLARAEMSLKGAMDTGGVISVDSEGRAILETAARVKAQISAKEVQLGAMRAFVTPQNPEFQRASEELNSLRSELAKLEGGRPPAGRPSGTGQAGLENIQSMRDLKYHQMLYELLAKQYEAARLDEAKDASLIQVLDPAAEPERKSGPNRPLIVVVATLLALFAAILWAFFVAARQRSMAALAARRDELQSQLRCK